LIAVYAQSDKIHLYHTLRLSVIVTTFNILTISSSTVEK